MNIEYSIMHTKEVFMMIIKEKLSMALAKAGMSQAELARKLETSPSNLNQKVNRNTLTMEDMEKIAAILGTKWIARFEYDDGTVI